MITELDIINSMLRTIGVGSLTANDTDHPDYVEAATVLDEVRGEVNALGYWYNTSYPSLSVSTNGNFVVPQNTLICDPVDRSLNYVLRGTKLFDQTNQTFVFTESTVHVKLTVDLEISEMPDTAKQYVRALARERFYGDNDGEASRYAKYSAQRNEAWARFYAENLKNRDTSALDSLSARRIRRGYRGSSSEGYTQYGYRS